MWLATGKIVSTSKDENLCRTQIEVKLNSEYNVNDLLTNPLGNHLIIVPGIFEELPIHNVFDPVHRFVGRMET